MGGAPIYIRIGCTKGLGLLPDRRTPRYVCYIRLLILILVVMKHAFKWFAEHGGNPECRFQ
jgi:hypothetical protein